jgi:hypothetical protein
MSFIFTLYGMENLVFVDCSGSVLHSATMSGFVDDMRCVTRHVKKLEVPLPNITPETFDNLQRLFVSMIRNEIQFVEPSAYPQTLELASWLEMKETSAFVVKRMALMLSIHGTKHSYFHLVDERLKEETWMRVFRYMVANYMSTIHLLGICPVWDRCIMSFSNTTDKLYTFSQLETLVVHHGHTFGLKLECEADSVLFDTPFGHRLAPLVSHWGFPVQTERARERLKKLHPLMKDDVTMILRDHNVYHGVFESWICEMDLCLSKVRHLHTMHKTDMGCVFPNVEHITLRQPIYDGKEIQSMRGWGKLRALTIRLFSSVSELFVPDWVEDLTILRVDEGVCFDRIHGRSLTRVMFGRFRWDAV